MINKELFKPYSVHIKISSNDIDDDSALKLKNLKASFVCKQLNLQFPFIKFSIIENTILQKITTEYILKINIDTPLHPTFDIWGKIETCVEDLLEMDYDLDINICNNTI